MLELRAIVDTEGRAVRAQSIDPGVFDLPLALPRRRPPDPPPPHRAGACAGARPADADVRRAAGAATARGVCRTLARRDGDLALARWLELRAGGACGRACHRRRDARRPGDAARRAGSITSARVRVKLLGGALESVSDARAVRGRQCGRAAAAGRRLGGVPVRQRRRWSASAPTNCRGCCAGRAAANGRWAIRCRRARRSCCSTSR